MIFSLLRKYTRDFSDDRKGMVTAEMAIITTAVFATVPLIYDLASVINSSMALGGGLRAGVQLAIAQPSNTSGITSTIRTASGFPSDSVTVTTTEFCECSNVSATCGIACYGGANPYKYVRVTANYSVPTLLRYPGFDSASYPLTRSITVRTQ